MDKNYNTFDYNNISHNKTILKEIMNYYNYITNNNYYDNNNFLPIKLSLSTSGLSGIRVGNLLRLNQDVLPKKYTDPRLLYAVISISHTINSDWSTEITLQPIIKDNIIKNNNIIDLSKTIYIEYYQDSQGNDLFYQSNIKHVFPNKDFKQMNCQSWDIQKSFIEKSNQGFDKKILLFNDEKFIKLLNKKLTLNNNKIRLYDEAGSGLFLSSRDSGKRTHIGLDLIFEPYKGNPTNENSIATPIDNLIITKINPYQDHPSIHLFHQETGLDFIYIHAKILDKLDKKYLPKSKGGEGLTLPKGTLFAHLSNLTKEYPQYKGKMLNHIHFQIQYIKNKIIYYVDVGCTSLYTNSNFEYVDENHPNYEKYLIK